MSDASDSTKRATSTSNFGVSRRENHDASDFYARFSAPALSTDDTVNPPGPVDWIHCGDARAMDDRLRPNSVALVVTSPPYFAGKAYEEELGAGHIPGSYVEYLQMLRDVFARCVEVLEPGGRIAVNVANLGRKPYRSLSADVISILQDDLGLLLRAEIIWRKAEGASGNCAWGSFQSASNPVVRDLTERVVVASKGRFDRARPPAVRAREGLPHRSTVLKDDFMSWTLDVWDVPTESATRVGHPAPFPVELPQRLIELYTYRGDLVLDPFMGSGSTAVAAVRTHRHYAGFDTDPAYVRAARARARQVLDERESLAVDDATGRPWRVVAGAPASTGDELVDRALAEGWKATDLARAVVERAGFTITSGAKPQRVRLGIDVTLTATDAKGNRWLFDVAGQLTRGSDRAGLRPTDVLWRALGEAAALAASRPADAPDRLVLLTTDLPPKGSAGAASLAAVRGGRDKPVYDVIALCDPRSTARLRRYAANGPGRSPSGELYPQARARR